MAVRTIDNRGGKKVIAIFPSKQGRQIWCESLNELNYAHLLDIDSGVLDFEHQPLKLNYVLDGKKRRYTPDFRVIRATGNQLIEVKPHDKAISLEWRQRFQAIAPEAHELGYEFKVVTDRMINLEPQLNNVKLLRRYFSVEFTTEHRLVAKELFQTHPEINLGVMRTGFEVCGFTVQSLYAMIYHGQIALRLDEKITPESRLFCQL